MAQFTLFPKLPQELQDIIWDFAIRDDGPATQFFTLYHARFDKDSLVPPDRRVEGMRNGSERTTQFALAAPHGTDAAPNGTEDRRVQSWVDGNGSAYMTDSGLWTACWNSRARMLQRFRPAETSSLTTRFAQVEVEKAREICQKPTATVTMPFQRDNGEQQYLTIQPMEDLLYFQFAAHSAVELQGTYQWKYIKDFPLFRWRRDSGGSHAPLHVRNIAIQCDPLRKLLQPGRWQQTLRAMGGPAPGDVAGLEGFWFVHYGLQRRYRVDDAADRRDRKTFRAGGDWEFVEVLRTDKEWWDPSVGDRAGGPKGSGSRSLVTNLELDAHLDSLIANTEEEDLERKALQNYRNNANTPRRGVLAYVKRGSQEHLPTRSEWIASR
jgi:hypothetical protein